MLTTIITTSGSAVLFDSVTQSFCGPIFEDHEEAEQFLEWLAKLRLEATDLSVSGLNFMAGRFREMELPVVLGRPVVSGGKSFEAVL